MTVPSCDISSPLLAKWLQQEMDNMGMTPAQLADKMDVPEKTIQGLLAAAEPTSEEASIWMFGFSIEVSLALGLPPNAPLKVLEESPAHQERSRRYHEMKKRSDEPD